MKGAGEDHGESGALPLLETGSAPSGPASFCDSLAGGKNAFRRAQSRNGGGARPPNRSQMRGPRSSNVEARRPWAGNPFFDRLRPTI
jgi:hypothetical protein